jgi:hypothetical protein
MEKLAKSTIGWILSRPEGKQFLSACMIIIVILGLAIVWQEGRYDEAERQHKRELRDSKQETIDILKESNRDAQRMRDSLYTMSMRQKEIERKINDK